MRTLISCCLAAIAAASYTDAQAEISFTLSNDAYCGKDQYMTHVYEGPAKGFKPTYIIYHAIDDTQGYIGYLASDNSIYVVFRGSSSIPNWITNLSTTKTTYTSFADCNCKVHAGFFSAEQAVITGVLNEVKRLRGIYPTAAIKTTGHSLGGAMAQLTGMDLIKAGYDVQMYNFGQPRIGDAAYSAYSKTKFPKQYRVVHHRDMVPHNPGEALGFVQTCTEYYEDTTAVTVKQCTNTCEDPSCSDQWSALVLNVDDHLNYLGKCIGGNCGQCAVASEEPGFVVERDTLVVDFTLDGSFLQ